MTEKSKFHYEGFGSFWLKNFPGRKTPQLSTIMAQIWVFMSRPIWTWRTDHPPSQMPIVRSVKLETGKSKFHCEWFGRFRWKKNPGRNTPQLSTIMAQICFLMPGPMWTWRTDHSPLRVTLRVTLSITLKWAHLKIEISLGRIWQFSMKFFLFTQNTLFDPCDGSNVGFRVAIDVYSTNRPFP